MQGQSHQVKTALDRTGMQCKLVCVYTAEQKKVFSHRTEELVQSDIRLSVICCGILKTHWHSSCWADWPGLAGRNRKAGRGKRMKLKLFLLCSIHATYGRM